jgi:hypothetical protein
MYEYAVIAIGDPRQLQGRQRQHNDPVRYDQPIQPMSESLAERLNELAADGYRLHTQLSMDRLGTVYLIMEREVQGQQES